MHEKVEPAVLLLNAREDGIDFAVVLDIERQNQRRGSQRVGELADVLFESTLIGQDDVAPASAAACAMAHESERLLATPTTRPTLPERCDMVRASSVHAHMRRECRSRQRFLPPRRRAAALRP